MRFSPCTSQCTNEGTHCEGCGRSHLEIRETQAITKDLVQHLVKYDYDDPENFLDSIKAKVLKRAKAAIEESNS
jgi:predicted Fe-S protein YdhL (DUF1289 family)